MPLVKKCKTCGQKKDLHKDFDKVGRKPLESCKECLKLEQAGLNPAPELIKKPDFDADRKRRQEQYRRSIERRRKGIEG